MNFGQGLDERDYSGPVNAESEPHGHGEMRLWGAVYVGEFRDGVACGTGTITTDDGTGYRGGWQNGEPTGDGEFWGGDPAGFLLPVVGTVGGDLMPAYRGECTPP